MTNFGPDGVTAKVRAHPFNTWYAAAWGREVTDAAILSRTVAGKPLALYRAAAGRPVAVADACWHRLAPLSMGKLVGADEIQCPYHGLRFNSAGRCTFMPAQQTINPSAMIASYPVVERHRFVWVWLGDPLLADPSTIPDMFQMDSPEWAGDGDTIAVDANYQLVVDNLMDLTHEEFVHTSSIGQDELSGSDFVVTHDDRTVTMTRWMLGVDAPAFLLANMRDRFPGFDEKVDRWQIIEFQAPSTIRIDVGVAKAGTGAPQGDRSQGVNGFVMNTITPATDRTAHYFWAFMRNWNLDDPQITARTRDGVRRVFGEDEAMLTAQQRAIDANPDYQFYNLNIDAGGMWTRRLIQRMLEAEQQLASPSGSEHAHTAKGAVI
ncbi:MAG: aromatic ring-hydroxylating dioxygenase subunit alpha [Hyphomicrobiales bacterium]|jgi:vanillate O-demethylase monooxygenase subunit|nr:MAG: aromatic ring-hydroxylating dioxygenase subunit alpha [Hyphomicrobiales bacterium]